MDRVARYGWAYDERDRAALADCFTDDAVWQGTLMGVDRVGPVHGMREIADWLAAFWAAQDDQRRHVFTNVVVEDPDGDMANAYAYLVLLASRDGATSPVSAGTYRFTLRRDERAGWRISALSASFDAPF